VSSGAPPRHRIRPAANASIALGTSEVSLLELTIGLCPFMNGGYKATPHFIRRVTTADGQGALRQLWTARRGCVNLRSSAT
jgi:membrane peptidoglycan carboxypeptidase